MIKIILIVLLSFISSTTLNAQNTLTSQKILFFLHNAFLEQFSINDKHPEYGKCEYKQILAAFSKAHFTVVSEIRPHNTNPQEYSKKIIHQIDSLIHAGINPSDITVVGTSRGGYIAQYVSTSLKNKDVNFVLIGCCNDDDNSEMPDISLYGNILSINERSDQMAQSCQKLSDKSNNGVQHFKEIELTTGLKHGFLFKALNEWILPSILWAEQKF